MLSMIDMRSASALAPSRMYSRSPDAAGGTGVGAAADCTADRSGAPQALSSAAASASSAAVLVALLRTFTRNIDILLHISDRRAVVDHDAGGAAFLTSAVSVLREVWRDFVPSR